MFGLLRGVLTALLTIILLLFAIINRQSVSLYWNPLGGDPIDIPLSTVVLLAMVLAFFFGAFMTWLGEGRVRRERRLQKREIKALKKDLHGAVLENEGQKPFIDFFPALTSRTKR